MRVAWMARVVGAWLGVVICASAGWGDEARVIFEPARETLEVLPNLVSDGGFENGAGARGEWRGYGKGYENDRDVKHGVAASIRCRASDISTTLGAVQRVSLKQREARPVVVEFWTRCEGTEFPPSSEYSLYCDVTYADGTREFGVVAKCPTDARVWERVELVLQPTRAIAAIDLYCLFRGTAGTAWFDDVACREVDPARVRMFDGEIVRQVAMPTRLATTQPSWMDDLVILVQAHDDGRIWEPEISQVTGTKFAFEVRPIKLAGIVRFLKGGSYQITLANWATHDRPVTAYWARRIAGKGIWWDDGVQSRDFSKSSNDRTGVQLANLVQAGAGKTGWMSRYPIGVVTADHQTLRMSTRESVSRVRSFWWENYQISRFCFDSSLGLFCLACDVVAEVDSGTRGRRNVGGMSRYSSTFDIYEKRTDEAEPFRVCWKGIDWGKVWPSQRPLGIWAPFVKISTIERSEDFGFAFKEGDNDVDFDEKHSILTFQYFYPQTVWVGLQDAGLKSYGELSRAVQALATSQASESAEGDRNRGIEAACRTAGGRDYLWPTNQPWCRGAVLAVNPLLRSWYSLAQDAASFEPKSGGRVRKDVDGPFFDSVDGWADIIDYRPATIETASSLAYDPRTKRIGVLNAISMAHYYDGWRDWADRSGTVHSPAPVLKPGQITEFHQSQSYVDERKRHQFTMANGCPTRYWWMAALFDVMGQEINWKIDGGWVPMSAEEMWYRRALCGKKPYCLLMNSDFDRWTVEDTRRYFMRCAAYGFFPSFFSHNAYDKNYWEQPAWYNRDRPVFKQFIPVLQTIGRAGWEPVTWGRSDSPREILVERFAAGDSGPQYWTVHNPTDRTVRGRVWLARGRVGGETLHEMLTGGEKRGVVDGGDVRIEVELRGGETWVLR